MKKTISLLLVLALCLSCLSALAYESSSGASGILSDNLMPGSGSSIHNVNLPDDSNKNNADQGIFPGTSLTLYINGSSIIPANQPLIPQVNVPAERIPIPADDDALDFALSRTRRSLDEKGDIIFRIWAHDMSLHGEPVAHEQLSWSSSDESIAAVDPATGWVTLAGKAGSCLITAVYADDAGQHTASYRVVAY